MEYVSNLSSLSKEEAYHKLLSNKYSESDFIDLVQRCLEKINNLEYIINAQQRRISNVEKRLEDERDFSSYLMNQLKKEDMR